MTADAAEHVVDVLHRQLRAGGCEPADHDLATLLVHPADVDRRLPGSAFPRVPWTYVR